MLKLLKSVVLLFSIFLISEVISNCILFNHNSFSVENAMEITKIEDTNMDTKEINEENTYNLNIPEFDNSTTSNSLNSSNDEFENIKNYVISKQSQNTQSAVANLPLPEGVTFKDGYLIDNRDKTTAVDSIGSLLNK